MNPGTLNTGGDHNLYLNSTILAKESLMRLKNELFMPMLATRTYEKYFEAKIGRSVFIKKPFQIVGSTGRNLEDSQISPMLDQTVRVDLDKRFKFSLGNISDENLTLEINDFGNHYLQAGVEECAEYVDEQCLSELALNIATVAVAGRAADITASNEIVGSFMGNSLTTEMTQYIRAHASEISIPGTKMNFGIVNPHDCASLSHDLKDIHVPKWVEGTIKSKFKGVIADYNTFSSTKVPLYVVANPGLTVGVVNKAGGFQGSEVTTDGWTASAGGHRILNKGQMICFAGVNEINPRGARVETGRLKSFVVTEDVDLAAAATAATIKIYPELNAGTGALTITNPSNSAETISKDAMKNASAAAADNAQIYLVGKKGKTYRQSVFYEKRALTFVPVMLAKLAGGVDSSVESDERTGLSVAINRQSEVRKMETLWRGDVMFGVKCIYPELGLRVLTAEL